MARFLDETGLKALWEKVKAYVVGQLKGYATTDALAEVRTVADGAQTSVDNMAVAVVDGQLEVTDKEGVTTGYALGGLSEGDANALEALKSRMAMFELVKTADDAPEKASVVIDGTAYSPRYGKKYAIACAKNAIFYGTWNKQSVRWCDFSQFDTSGFTSFAQMFACCKSMETIDVSGWDTSKVTGMGQMFYGCSGLQTLDVSGWETSKVTDMNKMFYGCSGLQTLDVSGWETSKVTNMQGLFNGCTQLQSLDVSGWDTSAVTNMWSMFYGCSQLQSLDVSGWETSAVTNIGYMIWNCKALTTLIGTHTLEEVEAGSVVALKGLKVNLDLSSTKLERASILAVIKGLADLTGGTAQTLTLGSTLKAKLTEADIKIATDKGWTIA